MLLFEVKNNDTEKTDKFNNIKIFSMLTKDEFSFRNIKIYTTPLDLKKKIKLSITNNLRQVTLSQKNKNTPENSNQQGTNISYKYKSFLRNCVPDQNKFIK